MFIYILKLVEWTQCCLCSKKNTIFLIITKVMLTVKFWWMAPFILNFDTRWRCVDGNVFELL